MVRGTTLFSATFVNLAMQCVPSHFINIHHSYKQCTFFLMVHITSPSSKNNKFAIQTTQLVLLKNSLINQHSMSSAENTKHSIQYAITSSLISQTHKYIQILLLLLPGKITGNNTYRMPINFTYNNKCTLLYWCWFMKKNNVALFLTESISSSWKAEHQYIQLL
jgi:hypothetical protein